MPHPPSRDLRLKQLLIRPALLFWSALVLALPFYIFKQGTPQPSHALVFPLVFAVVSGWNGRMRRSNQPALRALLKFTFWAVAVNVAWALILGKFGSNFLFPLYYLFNALIFFCVLVLYERYGDVFLRLTLKLVLISVTVQVVASLVRVGSGARHTLFFENPNQLGYYAMLAAAIIAVAPRHVRFSTFVTSAGLTMCAYLALLSASRAALGGIGLLFIILIFSNPRVIIIASLAALVVTVGGSVEESVDMVQKRITERRYENLTFFQERGYDRIWANKKHLLLGAGEGNTYRFKDTTTIKTAEIHSSAGTILFCYGIVGTLLFIAFSIALVRGGGTRFGLMLLPTAIYSTSHQGLRFTMLWILLALFVASKDSRKAQDKALAQVGP